jgi:putative intracellular protease/amidase
MRTCAVSAGTAALAAALVTSLAGAASPLPNLRSAVPRQRHVVVTFALGELAPGRILVATRSATMDNGKFVTANVRLDEPLRAVKTATGYRARTRHALPRGRYYIEVSGVVVSDCMPRKPCLSRWSNVRRIRIR